MRVLVVDDEKLARDRLIRMVGTISDYEVVGEAASGMDAVSQTMEKDPDIVLLDIRMPGMDGMEAGKKISELPSPPAIVFCTAFGEHAIDAFDVNAAGYLLKPVRRETLSDTLGKIGKVNRVQMKSVSGDEVEKPRARTHISAKTRRGIELIPLNEIRYFLADHKYVTVRHENGEVLIDDTLRELEDEFGERVVRIHRNALVMVDYLEGLERDPRGHYQVRMRNVEDRLDVSRRHVASLRRLVQSL